MSNDADSGRDGRSGSLRVHLNAVGAVMGGARRHLAPFVVAMTELRPSWSLVVWLSEGASASELPRSVERRFVSRGSHLARLGWENLALPRELRRESADALVNLTNSGPLRAGIPSLLYQRNSRWFDREWLRTRPRRERTEAVLRRALAFGQMRSSCRTIVPSNVMAEHLRAWRGSPSRSAIEVVPHAVDIERFRFESRIWPPPHDRRVRLLSVGHAAVHKNQELLPALVGVLAEGGVDSELTLTIAREDSPVYVDDLVQQCRALGVVDRVQFLGRVPDVERLYRVADIMVFPSLTESFGFPVAEAMASGTPVVASRTGSAVELLGSNAHYFTPGDVDGAVAAVVATLSCDQARMRERLEAAARSARSLTWEANAGRVCQLVEACAGR
jgi:glycosyltransferase involved in cell wall biosynthesis